MYVATAPDHRDCCHQHLAPDQPYDSGKPSDKKKKPQDKPSNSGATDTEKSFILIITRKIILNYYYTKLFSFTRICRIFEKQKLLIEELNNYDGQRTMVVPTCFTCMQRNLFEILLNQSENGKYNLISV